MRSATYVCVCDVNLLSHDNIVDVWSKTMCALDLRGPTVTIIGLEWKGLKDGLSTFEGFQRWRFDPNQPSRLCHVWAAIISHSESYPGTLCGLDATWPSQFAGALHQFWRWIWFRFDIWLTLRLPSPPPLRKTVIGFNLFADWYWYIYFFFTYTPCAVVLHSTCT